MRKQNKKEKNSTTTTTTTTTVERSEQIVRDAGAPSDRSKHGGDKNKEPQRTAFGTWGTQTESQIH